MVVDFTNATLLLGKSLSIGLQVASHIDIPALSVTVLSDSSSVSPFDATHSPGLS